MNDIELIIKDKDSVFIPVVEDGIQWETVRKNAPGKLTFSVVKDDMLQFSEGSSVVFRVLGVDVFYGFVFTKSTDKGDTLKVTAYDQLRYLKNKDTYVYTDKTASEVIKMLASDFNLNVGMVEDTGFKIASRVEDNKTLFDIIQNALDLTLQSRKKLYVLYDDFGKISLKDIETMKLDLLIDDESGEDYSYSTSIDSETYNQIKLSYENEESGSRAVYITKHGENINNWGVLQMFDTITEKTNGQAKADALLQLYNKKTKSLSVSNMFGDIRARAGASVIVKLDLGDVKLQNYMLIERVTHTFNNNEHFMNLTLRGGEFTGG